MQGLPKLLPEEFSRKQRCKGCRLPRFLCFCASMPKIHLPFEIMILLHSTERKRQSNTGLLAHQMLPESRVVDFGSPTRPLDIDKFLDPGRNYGVLYPQQGATKVDGSLRRGFESVPSTMIILDGSWAQARRMISRIPPLQKLMFYQLPIFNPRPDPMRRPRVEGQYFTIEAIHNLLEALEYREAATQLDHALTEFLLRMNFARGKINKRAAADLLRKSIDLKDAGSADSKPS